MLGFFQALLNFTKQCVSFWILLSFEFRNEELRVSILHNTVDYTSSQFLELKVLGYPFQLIKYGGNVHFEMISG